MIGKIKSVMKSKSGKAFRVQFEGSEAWYGAFLDSGIDGAVGKVVDAQITPNKGFGEGIGQWAYSQAPTSPAPANTAVGASTGASAGAYSDRWWLPFVSNQCAHLIAAGVIKDKASLNQWAKDLKETVIGVDAL